MTNTMMNLFGAPAFTWLLMLIFAYFILNNTAASIFAYQSTPLHELSGQMSDISMLLQFHFWEPVYYAENKATYLSDSTKQRGHFVGVACNVGHSLMYKVLTNEL